MLRKINPSSLFFKLVLPIIGLFTITIVSLGFYIPSQLNTLAVDGATTSAKQTAKQFKILRKYYVQNVVKKVNAGSNMKPAIKHQNDPKAFPLPATMIHDLSTLMKHEGTTVNLYSAYPFPNRKSRNLDSFQTKAWAYLVKNPESVFIENTRKNGKSVVRVAVADTMVAQGCVNCHNTHPLTPKSNWKLGDVRGVLEINSDISAQVIASKSTSFNIIMILTLTLLVIVTVIYFIYKRVIAKKLAALHHNINNLASGSSDLTKRLDSHGKDEISRVAIGFNTFLDNHQEFIKEISDSAEQLSFASIEMAKLTTQAQQDSSEQRSQIGLVATAVNEMTTAVHGVATNTSSADESAHKARKETEINLEVVQENIQITNSLSTEIQKASEVIHGLKSDSESIGSVLDVIRGISEQTNLLALNAAIEAARAGEHGRGFAVVADEVRTLASKTQTSTVEIQEMIERLQNGSDNAVTVMEKGLETVAASVKQATDTGDSLKSISEVVNQISDINGQIASAVEEQSIVAEDINKNVVTIDGLAQRGDDASTQIAEANKQLRKLAENLTSLVGQFKMS